jgi:hypothetical protein
MGRRLRALSPNLHIKQRVPVLNSPLMICRSSLSCGSDLLADSPQERCQFSRDCSDGDRLGLPRYDELAIARAKSDLRFPGDLTNRSWQSVETGRNAGAHPGRKAIGPCSFYQHAACARITGFGDTSTPHPFTGRTFRRHKSQIRHQLRCRLKPPDVSNFNRERDCRDERNAAHGLIGLDDGRHGPGCHGLRDLSGEPIQSDCGILDGLNILRHHDMMSGMVE